jgi:hypothetical protein
VHLAGEADAGDFFAAKVRCRKRLPNSNAGGTPPVLRVLLGPADLRRRERLMFFRGGGDNTTAAIQDDGAGSSGANVYSE